MEASKIEAFLRSMDRSLQKNLSLHLGWNKDEIRPLLRRRIWDDIEFWVGVFLHRRDKNEER